MKKIKTGCMMLFLSLFLAACGRDGAGEQRPEWTYVPERIEIDDENVLYGEMQLAGGSACYLSRQELEDSIEARQICRYSFADGELSSASVHWPMEITTQTIYAYCFTPEQNVWILLDNTFYTGERSLHQFDPEGKSLLSCDVTKQLGRDATVRTMATDGQGRLYVFADEETGICLYAEDGSYHGTVSYGSLENVQIRGIVQKEDGGLYVCVSAGAEPDHCILMEVDFEKRLFAEVEGEFPKITGLCADLTGQHDFLLYDNFSVWGYDLSTRTAQELFAWSDSDINGYFMKNMGVLEDGRYFCAVEDWWYEDRCFVLLTKMRTEDAPQKEYLNIATVGGGKGLTIMVVRFNRGNAQYHLNIKDYDTLTDLYNALLAKEPIDLIDLSGVDVAKLSGQGVFEDLTPWLERSESLSSSDFLEGILETYTFDGTLAGIPEAFSLLTVVGDKSLADGNGGMTLDGLIDAAAKNPDALPYGEMTKSDIMRYIMMLNEDAFIDWEQGECHFDSERFQKVLELAGRFPDSLESGPEEPSLPTRVGKGEVMMVLADLWRMDGYQLYEGICGEGAACIGFPAPDGQGGTLLYPRNAYGIVDVSRHKEGAWAFIEYILTRTDVDGMTAQEIYESYLNYDLEVGTNGLPTRRQLLDIMINYKMEHDRQLSPMAFPGKSFSDGWFFQYHPMTMDDVNVILELLKGAVPAFSVENDDIFNIINEEAYAYYSGQKGIDDVAGVIQNRVQTYVDENHTAGGSRGGRGSAGSSAADGADGQNSAANGSGHSAGSSGADGSSGAAEEQGDPAYYPNGRLVLTAAVTRPSYISDITEQIKAFNESNPTYFVEIKTYSGYVPTDSIAKMTETLEAQLLPDLSSGSGPDLVIWSGISLPPLASEKYMADLNGFMDSDPDFHREDYFENILEALERNGELYVFPASFSVSTMCGKAEELGTDKGAAAGWELGEILEAFKNNSRATECFSYTNKTYTLGFVGSACMDNFVDWNTGECHFDTPGFVELLEWCGGLPDGFENVPERQYEHYSSGKGFLYDVGLSEPWDMAEVRARFGEGELFWPGVPVAEGRKELGGGVVSFGRGFSICRSSTNQEGAWEFIKSFLEADVQKEMASVPLHGCNPILRSAFEEILQEAQTVEYQTVNGTTKEKVKYQVLLMEREGAVDFSCITEEDAETYRTLIENARRGSGGDARIMAVVMEEAEAFFQGEKDADAVAGVIQERVSEYLRERMGQS
ncbi:MAG: extracellular solute-binding protein [Eubacterium sp.]|nr:extracellular solute-binding protein [Eubacterium sp.]